MSEQPRPRDILDGKDAKGVSVLLLYEFQVEGDVDGYEDAAAKDGDEEEDPTHHTQEAEKGDGIETELVEEHRLLGMDERRYPREKTVVNLW